MMAQSYIGIELRTTNLIVAQARKEVVLKQPCVVAIDTRKK